jgi:Ferritin-like domain
VTILRVRPRSGPGLTRRQLLRTGIAGAVPAIPAIAALADPTAATAAAKAKMPTQAQGLTAALRVEQLAVFAYQRAIANPQLGSEARGLAIAFLAQEQAHLAALAAQAAVAGVGLVPPPVDVPAADKELATLHVRGLNDVHSEKDQLKLLIAVEELCEGTYYVALGAMSNAALLTTSAEIWANEAQHATALRSLVYGDDPKKTVPSGFAEGRH